MIPVLTTYSSLSKRKRAQASLLCTTRCTQTPHLAPNSGERVKSTTALAVSPHRTTIGSNVTQCVPDPIDPRLQNLPRGVAGNLETLEETLVL